MKINQGDVIVVTCPEELVPEARDNILSTLEGCLIEKGVRVILLEEAIEFMVAKKERPDLSDKGFSIYKIDYIDFDYEKIKELMD